MKLVLMVLLSIICLGIMLTSGMFIWYGQMDHPELPVVVTVAFLAIMIAIAAWSLGFASAEVRHVTPGSNSD